MFALATTTIERMNLMGDLNVEEVARRLGLNKRTATRYVAKGYFPGAYRLNPLATRRAEWRVPEEAVIAFERKREELGPKLDQNGNRGN